MEVGIKGDYTFVVTKEMLATAVGSGTVEVFATPAMIARMEDTATRSVMPYLEEWASNGRYPCGCTASGCNSRRDESYHSYRIDRNQCERKISDLSG